MKINQTSLLIICVLLLKIIPSYSQTVNDFQIQKKVLNLKNVILLAQDSSIDGIKARDTFNTSYWQYRNYNSERLPSLMLSLTPIQYNRDVLKRYISETNRDEYRSQQSMYSYGNLKLSQNIDFTGGQFYVISELGFLRTFSSSTYNQFTSTPFKIGYTQSLIGYNAFKWDKKIEPLKYRRSEQDYKFSLRNIAITAATYFFDMLTAKEQLTLAKLNLQRADTLMTIGKIKYNHGAILKSDLLTLQLNQLKMNNEQAKAKNEYTQTLFNLVSYIGKDINSVYDISLPDSLPCKWIDIGNTIETCRENNPKYLEMEQNILEAKRNLDKAKKQRHLEANVDFSIGFNQYSDHFCNIYKNLMQQDIVSIGVSIPLVDWGVRRGNYNVAKSNLEMAIVEKRKEQMTLEQNVYAMINDYNTQVHVLDASKDAMNLSTNILNQIILQFRLGNTGIEKLKDAFTQEQQSHIQYLSILKTCWLDYLNISKEMNL